MPMSVTAEVSVVVGVLAVTDFGSPYSPPPLRFLCYLSLYI